jgi:4'-phosphopantetheinyl transferase
VTLGHDTIDVWHGSLDLPPELRRRLEDVLSEDERERADRFRFERDRSRYVVGRGLLRTLLAAYVGRPASELVFSYSDFGKPALVGEGPRFNISHSASTVLFAFSPSFDVGVDVELIQPDFVADRIAERFFSPHEVAALGALPAGDRLHAFLTCWTRKEAFLKARGDGLTLELDSFDVTLTPGEPPQLLRTAWAPEERHAWRLVDLSDPARGHIAALAAPASTWQCLVHDIDLTTVLN